MLRGVRRAAWASVLLLNACSGAGGQSDAGPTRDAGLTEDAGVAPPACDAPETRCADRCVDTATDPAHCGACNEACSSDQACVDRACANVLGAVEPYVLDDGNRDCTTPAPLHTLAVGPDQRIYLGLVCDGELTIAVSEDRGQSFALVPVGVTDVQGFRLLVDDGGDVHLAVVSGPFFEGQLAYARSPDGGRTWPRPRAVDLGPLLANPRSFSEGFLVDGDDVYVASRGVGEEETTKIWRSESGGSFRLVHSLVTEEHLFETDLFALDGKVYLTGAGNVNRDLRRQRIFVSEDRGETFTLAGELPTVGGGLQRAVGDRIYYADSNASGLGYYSLNGDEDVHWPLGEGGLSSSALAFGPGDTLVGLLNTGEPFGQPLAPEFLVRLDLATGETERTMLTASLPFPDANPFLPAYSNTQVIEAPGTARVIVAFARDGDVNFRIVE